MAGPKRGALPYWSVTRLYTNFPQINDGSLLVFVNTSFSQHSFDFFGWSDLSD